MTRVCTTGRIAEKSGLRGASRSDTGSVRARNEDAVLLRAWPGDSGAMLAVVADGMGGYGGGDVASQIVVDEFAKLLDEPAPSDRMRRLEALLHAFYTADQRIRDTAGRSPDMGATAVAAIVTAGEMVHLYAGDCRLYHIHRGRIAYRTRDHSAVQVLVDAGKLSPEQARTHRMRNMVTSCLGGPASALRLTIDPHLWFGGEAGDGVGPSPYRRVEAGDRIVLCSDGLWCALPDMQIATLSARAGNPDDLVRECIALALQADGSDNISMAAIAAEAGSGAKRTGTMAANAPARRAGRTST